MTEFLETNGARIAYDVSGDGPAVVLIHAGVANRSMWDDQVAALKDGYRVIRYDTRGFGETETDAVAWEALADWETAFWADGPGQPADRVPEIRARVHDWILENYRAEKEEGEPRPLDPPAEARLADLRPPLLVMLGTLDEPSTTDAMRHLAASVPGARLEEFASAHMVNLEHPERFNRVLREFLDANRAPQA